MMDRSPGNHHIALRPMVLDDIEQVIAIDTISFSNPWSRKSYRFELTENQTAALWVAETKLSSDQNRIAGMIATWFVINEVHIATIAVHPDYRRQGIGARLLARGILHSAEKGATVAMLEVRRTNLGAQALYRRFGFTVVGFRPRYYHDNNEDALLMNLHPLSIDFLRQIDRGKAE